jgi:predicted dehydrogenase
MKSNIGIGIIGCGLMGGIHAACYARERGCRIAGFQNRSRNKAEALAKQFGGTVYATVAELLADRRIGAVSICSSQQVHAEQIIAAAKAGKDILSEKPLALTIRELDAVEKAVAKAGRILMVGHQLRFHPVIEWVRAQMPRLGPVYHLDLEMCFRIAGHEGRCWMDYRSGGFFMELGVHLADLARCFLGAVRNVHANTLRLNPKRVTEDFTHCLLQHRSNASSSILVSANHRTTRQGLLIGRMLGAKGRINFTVYPYGRELNEATVVLDRGKAVFVPDVVVRKMPKRFPRSMSEIYPGFFDVYQREVRAFLGSVRRRTAPPVTLADGRSAVEVVLAAYASQGLASEHPVLRAGGLRYRADAACHPLLGAR